MKTIRENSVWLDANFADLKRRVLEANTEDRPPPFVPIPEDPDSHSAVNPEPSLPKETAHAIERMGGKAVLFGEVPRARNLVALIQLPPEWRGTYLETVLKTTQAVGGHFLFDPCGQLVDTDEGLFLPHISSVVSPLPVFSRMTALHELEHLRDWHDPAFWETILVMRSRLGAPLADVFLRQTEKNASYRVLKWIGLRLFLPLFSPGKGMHDGVAEVLNFGEHSLGMARLYARSGWYRHAVTESAKIFAPIVPPCLLILLGRLAATALLP